MGSERSSAGKAVCSPPLPRVSLVVKGKKKGSCAEAAGGESSRLAASSRRNGLGTAAPSAAASAGGLWGALWGFGKLGGQHPFHAAAFGSFGRERRALLSRVTAGWSNHLTKPSAPCLVPAGGNAVSCIFSPPLPCPLCRSFLRAFLRVNQGENCSRSCLEATRG